MPPSRPHTAEFFADATRHPHANLSTPPTQTQPRKSPHTREPQRATHTPVPPRAAHQDVLRNCDDLLLFGATAGAGAAAGRGRLDRQHGIQQQPSLAEVERNVGAGVQAKDLGARVRAKGCKCGTCGCGEAEAFILAHMAERCGLGMRTKAQVWGSGLAFSFPLRGKPADAEEALAPSVRSSCWLCCKTPSPPLPPIRSRRCSTSGGSCCGSARSAASVAAWSPVRGAA
eukprot:296884-Chlamydomonas_euryale.AAC.1